MKSNREKNEPLAGQLQGGLRRGLWRGSLASRGGARVAALQCSGPVYWHVMQPVYTGIQVVVLAGATSTCSNRAQPYILNHRSHREPTQVQQKCNNKCEPFSTGHAHTSKIKVLPAWTELYTIRCALFSSRSQYTYVVPPMHPPEGTAAAAAVSTFA